MVDFKNLVVVEKDFQVMVKLLHFVDGIFVWEFFITLNYEWSIVQGNRPRRWTIWIYSLTRLCTLMAVILNMLGFDSPNPINCQLWVIFELIFASLAFVAASILIVLRIIAIWNRSRIPVAIAICAWSTNVAFLIYNMAQLHSAWGPAQSVCIFENTEGSKKTVIVALVADVVLLLIMLVGLLRMRLHGSMFGLGQLLWNQGLIWLFLATVAEVTPAVFISLNLNGPLNIMFQTPGVVGMTIAATQMYRSLTDFTNQESFHTYPIRMGQTANPDHKRPSTAPIPLGRVKVDVCTSSEAYPPAKMGQYGSYGPHIVDSQPQDDSFVLNIGPDFENQAKREGPEIFVPEPSLIITLPQKMLHHAPHDVSTQVIRD